jgi:peptidyl-prolyl cis-trans isomerase A (cyclophilin A)
VTPTIGSTTRRKPEMADELYATLHTTLGDIEVRLFPLQAPKTVENFVGLADGSKEWTDPKTRQKVSGQSLYAGTIFHRVIDGFMIQGGDPLGSGVGGPGYKFSDEISPDLGFTRPYLLAMANAGRNTNGSQFFITVAPTTWLTGKHTIFGEVTRGTDVVDAIVAVPKGAQDRPKNDVVIESIDVERRPA